MDTGWDPDSLLAGDRIGWVAPLLMRGRGFQTAVVVGATRCAISAAAWGPVRRAQAMYGIIVGMWCRSDSILAAMRQRGRQRT